MKIFPSKFQGLWSVAGAKAAHMTAALCLMVSSALVLMPQALAADKAPAKQKAANATSPDMVIGNVTNQLMSSIQKGKKLLKTDPEAYYSEVRNYLDQAVNFEFIAKQVMGRHYAGASEAQRKTFQNVFEKSLVETYVKGMSTFADLKMDIKPPAKPYPAFGKTTVVQSIKTPSGENNVAYVMGKYKDGDWQIINVVLNGANLGKIFRSQFDQSVGDNKGSIDAAIKAWNFTQ